MERSYDKTDDGKVEWKEERNKTLPERSGTVKDERKVGWIIS